MFRQQPRFIRLPFDSLADFRFAASPPSIAFHVRSAPGNGSGYPEIPAKQQTVQKECLTPSETTDGEAPMPLTLLAAEVDWLKP